VREKRKQHRAGAARITRQRSRAQNSDKMRKCTQQCGVRARACAGLAVRARVYGGPHRGQRVREGARVRRQVPPAKQVDE
jgi:hypothetical protein